MTLQEKLAEKRRQQSESIVLEKLTALSGLSVEGFDPSSQLNPPQSLWKLFSSYERKPDYQFSEDTFEQAARPILRNWLESLGPAPVAFNLSIGGHGELPWLRVSTANTGSLSDLAKALGELIALDTEGDRAIAVLDDEYGKLIFLEAHVTRS